MTDPRSEGGLYAAIQAGLDSSPGQGEGDGLWTELANRVDPAVYRPRVRPDVEVKTFRLRWGNDYAMVANPTELVHYQLQPSEAELLPLMDGTRTVKEIVVERLQDSGDLGIEDVVELVETLRQGNFLTDRFVDLREILRRASDTASAARQQARTFVRTLSIEWTGAHRLVAWSYRYLLRFFFRPAVAVPVGLIALLGLMAFIAVYRRGTFELGGGSAAAQAIVLLAMDYVLTFIHELGHAVVLIHYGRKVKSAGFMIYFGSPSFFVESSDVLMLDRGQRIVQSFAGPYAEVVVSGLASLFIWAFPDATISPFLYTWVIINYFVIFMNLIPLLELDGYFILADLIQVPDLRPRSLRFIRYDLWRKLRARTDHEAGGGLALYAILGIAFTIFSSTAIFFWETIFGASSPTSGAAGRWAGCCCWRSRCSWPGR
jgi:putative peptide zinc metalloprotease protein